MAQHRRDDVEWLADDVRAKILARRDLIAGAQGEITIRVFRRGPGYEIRLTVTTD